MDSPADNQKFTQIVQIVAPQSKLRRVWSLQGGLSASMVALEIQQPDGQSRQLIVRSQQQAGVAHNEFRLLQITHRLGLKTPIPYFLDLSGLILVTPYLVIDYIEGVMTFAPANLESHLQQLATHLAQIHSVDLAQNDLAFLPENVAGCAELRRERPSPSSVFPDATRIRATLAALRPMSPKNKVTLLHGDFWPGNSLWQDGQLTAVIDWEDAAQGDPLIDLARSRSEIVWIFGFEALDSFTRHYQAQMALDYSQLPCWDLCAALRQIRLANDNLAEMADYFMDYGRSDITPQTIQKNLTQFIETAWRELQD